ncbi:MAG TPA: hypothetical protein VIK84_06595 [Haloplasmataceae bacterium]
MKNIMKISLIFLNLLLLGTLLIVFYYNTRIEKGVYEHRNYHNILSDYVYAINYGTVENLVKINGNIITPCEQVIVIDIESTLNITVGMKVNKGYMLYNNDFENYYADFQGVITSIKRDENHYYINYIDTNKYYATFNISTLSPFHFEIGSKLKVSCNGKYILTEINKIESNGEDYIYTTKEFKTNDDILHFNCEVYIIDQSFSNVYYINLKYLNNMVNNRVVLKFCDIHSYDEYKFYEKEITVIPLNEEYAIITSENVKTYEMVYYDNR